jgi:hypothetical protein
MATPRRRRRPGDGVDMEGDLGGQRLEAIVEAQAAS